MQITQVAAILHSQTRTYFTIKFFSMPIGREWHKFYRSYTHCTSNFRRIIFAYRINEIHSDSQY